MFKRNFSLLVSLGFVIQSLYAYDFIDNGIVYSIVSETDRLCAVEQNEDNPYSGDLIIPGKVIHDNVTYQVYQVSSASFRNCSNLTSLTVPAEVQSIRNDAFYNCTALKTIIFEDSDTPITLGYFTELSSPHDLFSGAKLDYIYLGRNVEYSINSSKGQYGPLWGQSFQEIYLSDYVTEIGDYMFAYCYDSGCGINKIRFSPNIKKIGKSAFNQSFKLKSLILPSSLTTIGSNAFYGNDGVNDEGITEIILNNNVTTIGSYAFYNCDDLVVMYCYATTPPTVQSNTFSSSIKNVRLRVPAKSIELYKNATGWQDFGEILPLEDTKYPSESPLTLTLCIPNGGSISQNIKSGQEFNLSITPEDGWNIYSVTQNGVDVTANLTDSAVLSTGMLYESTEINIVFSRKEVTDVIAEKFDIPKINIVGSDVSIVGEFDNVTIYDIGGLPVYSGKDKNIHIATSGIYILKLDNTCFKFSIR